MDHFIESLLDLGPDVITSFISRFTKFRALKRPTAVSKASLLRDAKTIFGAENEKQLVGLQEHLSDITLDALERVLARAQNIGSAASTEAPAAAVDVVADNADTSAMKEADASTESSDEPTALEEAEPDASTTIATIHDQPHENAVSQMEQQSDDNQAIQQQEHSFEGEQTAPPHAHSENQDHNGGMVNAMEAEAVSHEDLEQPAPMKLDEAPQARASSFAAFVSPISDLTEEELSEAFSKFGTVISVRVNRIRNHGFVFFETAEQLAGVLSTDCNRPEINGQVVHVSPAQFDGASPQPPRCALFMSGFPVTMAKADLVDAIRERNTSFVSVNLKDGFGWCILDFPTKEYAEQAMLDFADFKLQDQVVHVIWARDVTDRAERPQTVYVSNLSPEITEDDLRPLFSTCGEIVKLSVARKDREGQKKCNAFIDFAERGACLKALLELNGLEVKGYKMTVQFSRVYQPYQRASRGFPPRGGMPRAMFPPQMALYPPMLVPAYARGNTAMPLARFPPPFPPRAGYPYPAPPAVYFPGRGVVPVSVPPRASVPSRGYPAPFPQQSYRPPPQQPVNRFAGRFAPF